MTILKLMTLAATMAVTLAVAAPTLAAQVTVPATVVDVIDGDTLRVDTANCDDCRVRMLEIDAPEHDQPYGAAARSTLSTLVNGVGGTVQLAIEGKDQYGRLLAFVYHKGRNIN